MEKKRLFYDVALFLSGNGISEESLLVITPPLMILGYPFIEKKFWAGRLSVARGPIRRRGRKCGIFEVKRRLSLGELHLLLK